MKVSTACVVSTAYVAPKMQSYRSVKFVYTNVFSFFIGWIYYIIQFSNKLYSDFKNVNFVFNWFVYC